MHRIMERKSAVQGKSVALGGGEGRGWAADVTRGLMELYKCFFFQAEDGIRDSETWLEFRRVLFRSGLFPTARIVVRRPRWRIQVQPRKRNSAKSTDTGTLISPKIIHPTRSDGSNLDLIIFVYPRGRASQRRSGVMERSVGGNFCSYGNILGTGILERILDSFRGVLVRGVNPDQNVARSNFAFVAFGVVFGNTHAHECSGDAADGGADGRAAQRRQDWTGGDKWTGTGNGEDSHPRQPTQCSTENASCAGASGGAICGLAEFVNEILGFVLIGKKD